jgi:hypothetical protein
MTVPRTSNNSLGPLCHTRLQQTPFIERFNRTYHNDVLDLYLFDDLEQAREITEGA